MCVYKDRRIWSFPHTILLTKQIKILGWINLKLSLRFIVKDKSICFKIATFESLGQKTALSARDNRWNRDTTYFFWIKFSCMKCFSNTALLQSNHKANFRPDTDGFLFQSFVVYTSSHQNAQMTYKYASHREHLSALCSTTSLHASIAK